MKLSKKSVLINLAITVFVLLTLNVVASSNDPPAKPSDQADQNSVTIVKNSNNHTDALIKCSGESKTKKESKCGSGKENAKKDVKADTEDSKKQAKEEKCGTGKCGGAEPKKSSDKEETKSEKNTKKSEAKCGQGKCGK